MSLEMGTDRLYGGMSVLHLQSVLPFIFPWQTSLQGHGHMVTGIQRGPLQSLAARFSYMWLAQLSGKRKKKERKLPENSICWSHSQPAVFCYSHLQAMFSQDELSLGWSKQRQSRLQRKAASRNIPPPHSVDCWGHELPLTCLALNFFFSVILPRARRNPSNTIR